MALVKVGPIVSDIKGTIGGVTYSRNRAGLYVKNPSSPGIYTPYSQTVKDNFVTAVNNWSGLIDSEARAWDLFAEKYGRRPSFINGYKALDGRALFIGCQMNIFSTGDTYQPTPTEPQREPLAYCEVSIPDRNTLNVTPYGGSYNGDLILVIYASKPQSLSVRSFNTPWYANFFNSTYDPGNALECSAEYLNRLAVPLPDENQRIFIKMALIDYYSGLKVGEAQGWTDGTGTISTYVFGDTTVYGSIATGATQAAVQFTSGQTSFLQNLNWYLDTPAGDYCFAVYSDNANKPYQRLCQSSIVTLAAGTGWYQLDMTPSILINSGTKYHLAIGASISKRNRYGVGGVRFSFATTSGTSMPAVWTEASTTNAVASVYANCLY